MTQKTDTYLNSNQDCSLPRLSRQVKKKNFTALHLRKIQNSDLYLSFTLSQSSGNQTTNTMLLLIYSAAQK